jgi:hypothetical protein
MLSAAYGGQVNKANMGLNADPRSEWESYKYNQENQGRTAGEVEPKSMGWGEYAQEWYDRLIGTPLKGMAGAGDALLGKANPDLESFEKNVLDALSLYAGPSVLGRSSATTLSSFGAKAGKETLESTKKMIESDKRLSGIVNVDAIGADGTTLPPGMVQITVTGNHPAKGGSFNIEADPTKIYAKLEQEAVKWSTELKPSDPIGWDVMANNRKERLIKMAGWETSDGELNSHGIKLLNSKWENLSLNQKRELAEVGSKGYGSMQKVPDASAKPIDEFALSVLKELGM